MQDSRVVPVNGIPELTSEEQRVLGSLLEKEITVPGSYPMTLNAVRTACNQTSSREPVVDYDEPTVNETLRQLRDADLVTTTWAGSGQRSVKFAQTVAARQGWSPQVRALLTVLLLRGAQPAGALKTRAERLHGFTDRSQVEATLRAMATAEPALVRELPRRPGQQDPAGSTCWGRSLPPRTQRRHHRPTWRPRWRRARRYATSGSVPATA